MDILKFEDWITCREPSNTYPKKPTCSLIKKEGNVLSVQSKSSDCWSNHMTRFLGIDVGIKVPKIGTSLSATMVVRCSSILVHPRRRNNLRSYKSHKYAKVKVSNLLGKSAGLCFSGSWAEKMNFLKSKEDEAKMNQTISSLLVSNSRDYLISSSGDKVPVSDLEGKLVGLYFSMFLHKPCAEFTQKLVDVCKKLKEKGDNNFEVVLVSLDHEEKDFRQVLEATHFLALPFKDMTCQRLIRYFDLIPIPNLPIMGTDGKILHNNAAELIDEHGLEAFPLSPEKVAELAEIEKVKLNAQTLESVLILEERDFVIDKNGSKNSLGKTSCSTFSAHWWPACGEFTPNLISAYHEIKAKDKQFEVIFISSDCDQPSFDNYFSGMPWLALPFGDPRKTFLLQKFKVRGIPALIALGPSGRRVTTEARDMIKFHGAEAYPFTEELFQLLEKSLEEMAKNWPEKIKHELHPQHDLIRTPRDRYVCDGCHNVGSKWSFQCKVCRFDLHPKCCMKMDEGSNNEEW
ncbi:hypothetical protein SAY86_002024 [Trapa natans]|uniref:protein-disulfide reductase n=1 Tax=Trapa natans TaxID=22666 RepID=A0AAN7LPX1_TRANT|nr:hypothetical protein SAY86_002024 [Trapa natans]